MQRYLTALRSVFVRNIITLKRYYFNTLSSLISLYMIFMFIYYGARGFGGPAMSVGNTLEGILVGYLLWTLSIMAFSDLSWDLNNQAQVGTLEQLYVTPVGFNWLNACNLLSNLVVNFVMAGALLLVMMISTGKYLNLDLISTVPLLLLSLGPAFGIGFAMGGLALIFKRIQSFFQIFQFVFVGFITIPWHAFPWARYLPLAMGNRLLGEVMVGGLRIWQLAKSDMIILVWTSIVYLGLGLLIFRWCESIAKDKGLLGQY